MTGDLTGDFILDTPRETRLRERIDSLMDECERLNAKADKLERDVLLLRSLVQKWTKETYRYKTRAEVWKVRCVNYRHDAQRYRENKQKARRATA